MYFILYVKRVVKYFRVQVKEIEFLFPYVYILLLMLQDYNSMPCHRRVTFLVPKRSDKREGNN